MKKSTQKIANLFLTLVLTLTTFAGLLGLPVNSEARIMNVEKTGSLTIHKYLNPEVIEGDFPGDGTGATILPGDSDPNTGNGELKPLPGAEFSVYGRLTTSEVESLMVASSQGANYDPEDPKPLDVLKVNEFIATRTAEYKGVTGANGQISFNNIPINTVDLADNIYLVVETKTPTSGPDGKPIVQQASRPVVVNIPSTNPEKDTSGVEVNNYIYDINLFMKNYNQTEPDIEKEVDKPSHTIGEEVKYTLKVKPLAFDMAEYQELIVTDELAKELDFYMLGHSTGPTAAESVVFYRGSGTDDKVVMAPVTDYVVTTPKVGESGTIVWTFTEAGIKKLTGIEAGDGSRIELSFSGLTNNKLGVDGSLYNDAKLDFVNKWGYGTKPPKDPDPEDPKIPTEPKPTESVNTIIGQRYFEKRDKKNETIKLEGAEFLVRNKSTLPISAFNETGAMATHPAGTQLYGIIKDGKTVSGWTTDYQKAYDEGWSITSDSTGKFHVEGLSYTNEIHFRKMYIFSQMKIVKNSNGTDVEVVDSYQYVLANKRTAATSETNIESEIGAILTAHPGDSTGNGAWKFYKESDASVKIFPAMSSPTESIDYLGDAVNAYELIEIRAPEGYAPIENVTNTNPNAPTNTETDPYEHPFAFTVPGFGTDDKPIYGVPDYTGSLTNPDNNVVAVPNAKMPKIPLTGGIGTIVFLAAGIVLVAAGYVIRRKSKA